MALNSETNSDGVQEILDAVPDAVVVVRFDGSIAYLNKQATAFFGWLPADLLGKPVETLLPERYRGRHVTHRGTYAAAPRVRPMGQDLELYALHAGGNEVPVEISLSPLTFRRGRGHQHNPQRQRPQGARAGTAAPPR